MKSHSFTSPYFFPSSISVDFWIRGRRYNLGPDLDTEVNTDVLNFDMSTKILGEVFRNAVQIIVFINVCSKAGYAIPHPYESALTCR